MAKYQYETSPRKTIPEYNYNNKRKQEYKDIKKKQEEHKRQKKMIKIKTIFYVIIAFAMFFTISYRNAVIDIKYSKIKNLKSELATIEKENEQLEANVEQALNLKAIQEEAEKSLGMKILSTDQIEYINLPKKDHIESKTQEQDEPSYFEQIISFFKNLIK